jgi:hypothetical protein
MAKRPIERLHEEFKRRIMSQPTLRPRCSEPCSPLVRSPSERSMVGKRSPSASLISGLTLLREPVPSVYADRAAPNSNTIRDGAIDELISLSQQKAGTLSYATAAVRLAPLHGYARQGEERGSGARAVQRGGEAVNAVLSGSPRSR